MHFFLKDLHCEPELRTSISKKPCQALLNLENQIFTHIPLTISTQCRISHVFPPKVLKVWISQLWFITVRFSLIYLTLFACLALFICLTLFVYCFFTDGNCKQQSLVSGYFGHLFILLLPR